MTAPDPAPHTATDLLPIVRAAAGELTPEELAAPILVGVSGGPDSLALLHLLWRWSREGGGRLRAVQVDHALRPGSGAEAARVAAFCAARGIPVSLRRVEPGAIAGGRAGLEEAARAERYRLFAAEARAHGARALALGHQADDQAETLLLHLLRGAGLAGLAGMPTIRRSGDLLDHLAAGARPAIWRPLLTVRRAAILAYCRAHGLDPSHDPSNDDITLRRNAIRHRVLPLLEEHFPDATAILAREARLLADDEAWQGQETARAWARCATTAEGLVLLDRAAFRAEHRAVQRRLLRRAWLGVRGLTSALGLGQEATEAARLGVVGGRSGGRWALPGGVAVLVERERAAVGPAGTIEAALRLLLRLPLIAPGWSAPAGVPGDIPLPDGWGVRVARGGAIGSSRVALALPGDWPGEAGPPLLRSWQPGDRLVLPGGRGTQKLQDWFVDHHIPRHARGHLPLLAVGSRILWIAGLAAFPPAAAQIAPGPPTLTLRLLYNGVPVEAGPGTGERA